MNKLTLAISIFSFITGIYVAVIVNKYRDANRPCHVTYQHDNQINVLVGEYQR